MYLAVGTGTQMLGSIGLGGAALILATALILGTKQGSEHQFAKGVALAVGLAAGTVWIAAGQVWDLPSDLTLTVLSALGVGDGGGALGDVGMGAIALVCVLVAYLVRLQPRAAGVLGVIMASVFATAGGAWAEVSMAIGDFATQIAA